MRMLEKDLRHGTLKVKVETAEDLWSLSQIIEAGDMVEGSTIRKIKLGGEEDRKSEVIKRHITLRLAAEKVDFETESLRISGTILEGFEDIPKGAHHTLNIEQNSKISIVKHEWHGYQLDKIEEACNEKPAKILICVFDREEAYFALLKRNGHQMLSSIKGDVEKKDFGQKGSNFFAEIVKELAAYEERYNLDSIILASPAFWKEELIKNLNDEKLRKKMILATCSSATESAIQEVLKRDELKQALKQERSIAESGLVEEFLSELSKDNLACYGLNEVRAAAISGAINKLLVTDFLLHKARKENLDVENVMKMAEKTKAEVKIISSQFEAGKKLDALSGIAAILRFKIT